MNGAQSLHRIRAVALADFRERTRQYSFLVTLGLVVYLGWLVNSDILTLRLDTYRGVFTSAWAGSMMSMVVNIFLSLFGFCLVKNNIDRDSQTGVGQILAGTPLSKSTYLIGKWLSNFAVLSVMVLILAIAAVLIQWTKQEAGMFDLWALLAPMLFLSLPVMALTGALAVFFEAIPLTRGGLGNIFYFILWVTLLPLAFESGIFTHGLGDPFGINTLLPSMSAAAKAAFPAYTGGFSLSISPELTLKTFPWDGIYWGLSTILPRLGWFLLSLGFPLVGAIFFPRFDPAARVRRLKKVKARLDNTAKASPASRIGAIFSRVQLHPRNTFLAVWLAEVRILLNGRPWWGYLIAAGIALASIFSPAQAVSVGLLPAAWIFPILIWSGMGCLESRHNTGEMIFSAAHPLLRQFPAAYLAGVSLAVLTGSGAGLNYLFHGNWSGLALWVVAIFFIPALALAAGVWSNSSRLFEVVYMLWWYLGPINHQTVLDFIGTTPGATQMNNVLIYAILSAVLLTVAWAGRWRQVNA